MRAEPFPSPARYTSPVKKDQAEHQPSPDVQSLADQHQSPDVRLNLSSSLYKPEDIIQSTTTPVVCTRWVELHASDNIVQLLTQTIPGTPPPTDQAEQVDAKADHRPAPEKPSAQHFPVEKGRAEQQSSTDVLTDQAEQVDAKADQRPAPEKPSAQHFPVEKGRAEQQSSTDVLTDQAEQVDAKADQRPAPEKPSAQHFHTPKRKRCPESPPFTKTQKTPRLNFEEKISQPIPPQLPPNRNGRIKSLKPRNPHPNFNLQEFVKIGNYLTLMKHRGVAITSRKSLKQKKSPRHNNSVGIQENPSTPTCPMKNTPRKCYNFNQLLQKFSHENPSTPPSRVPGKKSINICNKEKGKKSLKWLEQQAKLDVHNLSSKLPKSEKECKTTTSNVSFTELKSKKLFFKPLPPAPKNLLREVAMGKINTIEDLETQSKMRNLQARPAPSNLLSSAANSSAPKLPTFPNSKFGGKKPPLPPNQSEPSTNFSLASKKSDWIAP